jgi:hypothetical protein
VETARKQARQMRDEVNLLRTQKESFINRLRQILVSQIELLSVLEMDDAIPEEAQVFVEKARNRKKASLKQWVEKQKTEKVEEESEEEQVAIELAEEAHTEDLVVEEEILESEESEDESFRVSQETRDEEVNEQKKPKKKMEDEDINEFFKRGIQIDELIQNLEKKRNK